MSERNLRQDDNFLNLINELEQADGYFLGINILKDNQIQHRMVTENFPKLELLSSLLKIKEKCIEELEKKSNIIQFPSTKVKLQEGVLEDGITKDTK